MKKDFFIIASSIVSFSLFCATPKPSLAVGTLALTQQPVVTSGAPSQWFVTLSSPHTTRMGDGIINDGATPTTPAFCESHARQLFASPATPFALLARVWRLDQAAATTHFSKGSGFKLSLMQITNIDDTEVTTVPIETKDFQITAGVLARAQQLARSQLNADGTPSTAAFKMAFLDHHQEAQDLKFPAWLFALRS